METITQTDIYIDALLDLRARITVLKESGVMSEFDFGTLVVIIDDYIKKAIA